MIGFPYRYGGLSIQNPTITADREFLSSCQVTTGLTNLIHEQDMDITKLDNESCKKSKADQREEKENILKQELDEIISQLEDNKKRSLMAAQEK